jgi:hypothetical protein
VKNIVPNMPISNSKIPKLDLESANQNKKFPKSNYENVNIESNFAISEYDIDTFSTIFHNIEI